MNYSPRGNEDMTGFAYQTAASLARKLRKGAIDPVELAEWTFEAIGTCADQAIFTELLKPRALKEARAAQRRLKSGKPAGLLDGVPIGWKDLFDIESRTTTAGSVILKDAPPARRDATLVAAAKSAGLVSVGCLNMTEFAYSGIGLNPHYGTPRNPFDEKTPRIPGGSSSGSAIVVARGLLPVAIGTDTGGSIRIPASLNGLAGYKSSTGHYPMDGVFPLSRTLDTLGPLAATVEDCVLADATLRGLQRANIRPQSVKGQHILVPRNIVFDACEEDVMVNFEKALGRLSKAGARIEKVNIPAFDAIMALMAERGHLLGPEALHVHWDRVHGPEVSRMDPRVSGRILMAGKMMAVDLVHVLLERKRLIAETEALIGDRLVAFPTTPHVAMPIAPLEENQETFFRANAKTLRNTMLGNFLDWCGVSLPSGRDRDGMPTGFLLSAPHGRDRQVLSAAWGMEDLVRPGP
jgi:aspartyl-tRNA(Asn)/glutamyl-tRNA(Gln) amidotransferase subunit A